MKTGANIADEAFSGSTTPSNGSGSILRCMCASIKPRLGTAQPGTGLGLDPYETSCRRTVQKNPKPKYGNPNGVGLDPSLIGYYGYIASE